MTLQTVNKTDLQFSGSDAVSAKLRRLVQDLQSAEAAINQLVNAANAVSTAAATTTPASSELFANPDLQPAFELADLVPGTVLKALSATSAAFALLGITDLGGQDISNPQEGDYLVFEGGFWRNVSVSGSGGGMDPETGINIGTGSGKVYAGIASGALAFRTLLQGTGMTITETADTITLASSAGGSGINFPFQLTVASLRV